MRVNISVIIPAYNAEEFLTRCLQALADSVETPYEIIVVDDGSTDGTRAVAERFKTRVLTTEGRKGPALARNQGAQVAEGDVLFFLDSDVCVKPDTLGKIAWDFEKDDALDALIGSYDTEPASPDFISQYRNLMHSYVHQKGAQRASTFWSGCGAIRRAVFLEHSGFSESYGRPAIEDIELGYRLIRGRRKIILDHSIQVTHLKRWTFWNLVKTDIMDRGIPWTELILRDRHMPNDLNLQLSQRVSVALVFLLVGMAVAMAALSRAYLLIPALVIVFLMMARWWGDIGSYRRPRRAVPMLIGSLAIVAEIAYSQKMYGLIPFLVAMPVLLVLRHRYSRRAKLNKAHRRWGIVFICGAVVAALHYLPTHPLIFAGFVVVVMLALLNSQFYLFLAGKRGVAFMLAAIPFHVLYHFYSGVSFLIGVSSYMWMKAGPQATAPEGKQPSA